MITSGLEDEFRLFSRYTVDVDSMAKRARRKMNTHSTMEALINTLPHSDMRWGYKKALECCDVVKKIQIREKHHYTITRPRLVYDGFMSQRVETVDEIRTEWGEPHAEYLKGFYCKKRWCTVCNNIRSVQAYVKYGPVLTLWKEPYFVTLTVRNVPAGKLYSLIDEMGKTWGRMTNGWTQEKRRKKLEIPSGMRKLECTYNSVYDDYHPHYHVICDSQRSAERIRDAWLAQWPPELAAPAAQNMKPADRNTIFELFKYFAKSISRKEGDTRIYPEAMDTMFRGMGGRRIIQDFNMAQYKTVFGADAETEKPEGAEFASWFYFDEKIGDWFNANDRGDRIVGNDLGPETLQIRQCKPEKQRLILPSKP